MTSTTKDKIVPVSYRTEQTRKEEFIHIILRTKPKYRSISHFIDHAVDMLIREEIKGITRKEVYQYDIRKTDRKDNLGFDSETNDNNTSEKTTE